MPPAVKYSKEAIIDAALAVVRQKGFAAIYVRTIAKELGCSIQPIFRESASMDEIKASVYTARALYNWAMFKAAGGFLSIGLVYIQFAG